MAIEKLSYPLDSHQPVYGLILPQHNRFYVVDNSYRSIKLTQLVTCKYTYSSIINITHYTNDHGYKAVPTGNSILDKDINKWVTDIYGARDRDLSELDHDNCHLYGLSPAIIRSVLMDLASSKSFGGVVDRTKIDNDFDNDLKIKFYVFNFIVKSVLHICETIANLSVVEHKEAQDGLRIFSEFFAHINPRDKNIRAICENEIKVRDSLKTDLSKVQGNVYNAMMNCDLDLTAHQLVENLREQIKTIYETIPTDDVMEYATYRMLEGLLHKIKLPI